MPDPIGYRRWAIAYGCRTGAADELACILNASNDDARVELTIFFADREPVGPYVEVVPARRSRHIHMGGLTEPAPVPADTGYSTVIESDLPVVVQHSRLESGASDRSMLTTIAYAGD
jgi:hypothetical protein